MLTGYNPIINPISLELLLQILSRQTCSEDLRNVNFSHVCMKHKPRVNLLKKEKLHSHEK